MEEQIRLQKYIADCGIASRRKAEELMLQGRIQVNGIKISELGVKINPKKDEIKYDGKTIKRNNKKVYILLNKPIGYVTTVKDQFDRDTVLDLIKTESKERLIPVGRLDMYTSGALILTNDGEFIYKTTHPKYEIEKTYNVIIEGIISKQEIEKLENGVEIDDNGEKYKTKKAKVNILKTDKIKNISKIEIRIHEGKNRQIRKMCEAIEKKVLALHRSKIGTINVIDIENGKWRYLNKKEVEEIIKNS